MCPAYCYSRFLFFFFFNHTAPTEIYTLSLHDALPISCTGARCGKIAGSRKRVDRQSGRAGICQRYGHRRAGGTCTINVTFTPTASGARTGTLSLTDNAGGSPQIMTLSGNGTAAGVGLAHASLGFGNQPLATTSAPMTVTLTNTGTAALTINSFAASGDF